MIKLVIFRKNICRHAYVIFTQGIQICPQICVVVDIKGDIRICIVSACSDIVAG